MKPRFAVQALPEHGTARSRPVRPGSIAADAPAGGFVLLDGEEYYRITAVHRMPPFLMSIASDCDLWNFVSSRGGLTAGRVDADGSLFPYETVDRLHDAHHCTGPVTLLRVRGEHERSRTWRPFSEAEPTFGSFERNLHKNTIGNRVVFEEIRHDLALAIRYRWSGCDEFGLVRTVTIENLGDETVEIDVLDGLRNVLPFGVPLALYQQSSSLVDAYKRVDVDPVTRMGVFALTSKILDRAEAAEELRANVVWCCGLEDFDVVLAADAITDFLRGNAPTGQQVLTGQRGNYLVSTRLVLGPGASRTWHLVADVGCDHSGLALLRTRLSSGADLVDEVDAALERASTNLLRSMAAADGLQMTGHPEAAVHHFANVLFNAMRGGVFAAGNRIPVDDLADFVALRNRPVAARTSAWMDDLGGEIDVVDLRERASACGDADLERLVLEYLPLYFGRRHGDPSRPWNRFRIVVKRADGRRALNYEGNWRDIFQNWEALCASHPAFLPHMIAKFVNASTMDGFNPYRVTREGIDWEVVDPDDPWSYIGYWGDHQIVYLLRFLEALERHDPGMLGTMLEKKIFSYANVPYRIAPYREILVDPRATISFDVERATEIATRVEAMGTDAKLVLDASGRVIHVTLFEKLLVPLLAKLSNFVPGSGIWMNTQRPEWNDANNALVGNGVSVVTLCHLRRYVQFLVELLGTRAGATSEATSIVVDWLEELAASFGAHEPHAITDVARRELLDELGLAFSRYRDRMTAEAPSSVRVLDTERVARFLSRVTEHLDAAIAIARRADGLFHSYDLLELDDDPPRAGIHHLYEMLEGQVAALSSGTVDPLAAVQLLDRMFESPLYRADQKSFLLYPVRELPDFLARNTVSEQRALQVPLLVALLRDGDRRILARDATGVLRFAPDLRNAADLRARLDELACDERLADVVREDLRAVLEVFEATFGHRRFTGRSGAMYGYEGIGCIYWHMVAKLLLAVQEIHHRACEQQRPRAVVDDLSRAYHRVRDGLGFVKTPAQYGAFPTDPYSHTPAHAGAQQPGMTGQVKEEILTRLGEFGVYVHDGRVRFAPRLLRRAELLAGEAEFRCFDVQGRARSITIPAGGLAFTYCQVPIVYEASSRGSWLRVVGEDGGTMLTAGDTLDRETSRSLFERRGEVHLVEVGVPESSLLEF